MEINRKARRSGSASGTKAKRPEAEHAKAAKGATKKAARAADKVARQQDAVERRLREELEGSGAPHRARDLVSRLLGPERTPATEQLIARLQAAGRLENASPYGP